VEDREDRVNLAKAEELLSDLYADLQTAPVEMLPLIDAFAPRLEEAIERFKAGLIAGRELEAHARQIQLSYMRDLTRLLASDAADSLALDPGMA
jgi:hypothetical protein